MIKITVSNGRHSTYDHRKFLADNGFVFEQKTKMWKKEYAISDKRFEKTIFKYCKKNRLIYKKSNSKYERGTDYRKTFFSKSRPFIGGLYFCIYCGKLISKKRVEVDHIIPVHKAQEKRLFQKIIDMKKWSDINDCRNLGASCRRCNRKKSDKTGLWTIRGFIGKSDNFQVVRFALRLSVVCVTGYFLLPEIFAILT